VAALTPAVRAHLWRLLRYPAFVSIAAALIAPLLHDAILRWPAIGVVVALLEIVVRTINPTEPAGPVVVPGSRIPPA
jgi:hypothetical protein